MKTPSSDLSRPALLLIDPGDPPHPALPRTLEQAGIAVHTVHALEEAQPLLATLSPALVALVDHGGALDEGLALLRQIKETSPYRRTLVFTDRRDADFQAACLLGGQADHILPLTGEAEVTRAQMAAVLRTAQTVQELVAANHSLSRSSKTDSLTGLYNHGHILEWLRIEHKRAARDMEPLCVAMLDLDHFKFINDTYGHAFGDSVLRQVAELLRSNLRESDIVGRYGGEEFLILAPKTNALGGHQLAEKLRRTIEAHAFRDEVFDVRLTASIGVATSDHSAATTSECLLQLADKALYEAKEAGRNTVRLALGERGSLGTTVRAEIDAVAGRRVGTPAILVVDDSPLMLEMLRSVVESLGYSAIEATDGQQALDIVKVQPPDCVLLDVSIPGMDGFQLCRQIKALHRDIHIPVIFVTSERALSSQLQGYESGADDYVTRPVIREQLIAKIQAQMRTKTLHDRLRTANAKLKQAQRTLMRSERLKAIGQLAAGLAHDFNNVLGSILGHAQVLQSRAPQPEILRGLQAIEAIAQEGAETIRRLQSFSQPPPRPEEFTPVDIAEVLEDSLAMTRVLWKDEADIRGVRYLIEKNIAPNLTLRSSAADLREVFTNLLINAFEAMPRGGTLTISACRRGEAEILVEIRDTGVGIAPDLQRRIFDPFFTTKPDSGAGLGLSIVYGIVTRLSGRIDLLSRPGSGSTFRVLLPCEPVVEKAPEPESAAPAAAAEAVAAPDDTPTVMIIDDEPHIREVFTEILTDHGYRVLTAVDGEQGLTLFRAHPCDIVLTDLGMPGASGWEVARQIRQAQPDTKIVLTSGWGTDFEAEGADHSLVDAVLPKPVSLRALVDCVTSLRSPNGAKALPTTG